MQTLGGCSVERSSLQLDGLGSNPHSQQASTLLTMSKILNH